MARQVLPIIGGLVGSYFGYPQLGFVVGGLLGGLADPEVAQGPKIGELAIQSFDEGSPRAIIYGTSQCSGYVMEAGMPIKTTEVVTGDKGAPKSEKEVVYRNYAIAICEGPIAGVLRVWSDDKLVFDVRPGSPMLVESYEWAKNKTFYLGSEEQLPDIFLGVNVSGVTETPAFRGTAYMFALLDDLTDRRGSIPQFRFEVTETVISTPLEQIPSVHGFVDGYYAPVWFDWETIVEQSSVAPFPDARVGLFKLEIRDTIPEAQVVTDFTVVFGSGEELRGRIIGNGSHVVEMLSMNQPIQVDVHIEKLEGVETPLAYDSKFFYPAPSELDPAYTAYYGGGTPPNLIYPDDRYFGVLYDPVRGIIGVDWGPAFLFEEGGPTTLNSIVSDLHTRVGLGASDFDVSELTNSVAGLTLSGDYSAASAIDVLRSCYFFDKCEPGDKIRYPKRGKPVALTLSIDDLVELPDLARREQVSEVPKKIHLHYSNALAGYAPIKATYMRSSQDDQSTVESTVQVPVVLDVDEAARMVEKMFKVTATDAQGEITISVPDSFIRLVASDCIGLNLRGQVRRLRIDEVNWADGVMQLTCRVDRQSAYTSVLTGIPVDPPVLPPSTIVGDTVFAVLDIPARIDSEDDLNYLVAGSGTKSAWAGWAYQRSADGGANYTTVSRIEQSTVMARLVDPVPSASEFFTDTTNVVRVRMIRPGHVLESLTEQQFLSEQGAFALQLVDGSWEILQYLDADDEGDGVYALRTLHRGLLNTTPGAHVAGALFVRLDRATHISAQAAWLGADLTHRGVSLGVSPEGAAWFTETFQGRSQVEWPVAYLAVGRDGSNVLSGSWTPRHRFGSDDLPVASINFQGYRVTVTDGVATASFDRLTPDFTYDASAMSSPVTVSVSAVNRITGAGPATSESI